jgi:hypothetical protein
VKISETTKQTVAPVQRSQRLDRWRGLTSCKAGVIVPLAYFPLLREDSATGMVTVDIKMDETVKPLLNGVRAKVMAHLYPNSADKRFSGIEQLNASYMNIADFGGAPTPPFVEMGTPGAGSAFTKALGLHWKTGTQVNMAVLRAYNHIINYRRMARSWHIPQRAIGDTTLAEAFWHDANRWAMVPDFDQSMIEGQVPISGAAPVSGFGLKNSFAVVPAAQQARETGSSTAVSYANAASSDWTMKVSSAAAATAWPRIYAELETAGVYVSLANIELAKKTQAFAELRQQYEGVNEDYIIDMLMSGIRVPDASLFDPILLGSANGIFGMQERHAMDYENLSESYTTGKVSLRIPVRCPPINPGGLILITLEIVPESLPELGMDAWLEIATPSGYPDYVDDTLDPEKVDLVPNRRIDAYHAGGDSIFGYESLNNKWNRDVARLGGKFKDAETPSVSEERYRVWQVRPTDPKLAEDFYICPSPFPHDVFADTLADPFEVTTLANLRINGNTVFGRRLEEDKMADENVMFGVDVDRIEQQAVQIAEGKKAAQTPAAPAAATETKGEENGTV